MNNDATNESFSVEDWARGSWSLAIWNHGATDHDLQQVLELRHYLIEAYARRISGLFRTIDDWSYFLEFFSTIAQRGRRSPGEYAGLMLEVYKPLDIFVNGPHQYEYHASSELRILDTEVLSLLIERLGNIEGAVGSVVAKNQSASFEDLLDIYNSCQGDLKTIDAFGERNCVRVVENPNFFYDNRLDKTILEKISQDINVSEWRRKEAVQRLDS